MTNGFLRDRAMSLHRRAFELVLAGGDRAGWTAKARRLECPEEAIDQIWKTANTAHAAGMAVSQAFPLLGEIDERKSNAATLHPEVPPPPV